MASDDDEVFIEEILRIRDPNGERVASDIDSEVKRIIDGVLREGETRSFWSMRIFSISVLRC